MPVKLSLCEDGRVIQIAITDPWRAEDLLGLNLAGHVTAQQHHHPVHFLIDIRQAQLVPHNLVDMRDDPVLRQAATGWIVVLGARPISKALIRLVYQLSSFKKGRFVDNETEAWNFIRQVLVEENSQTHIPRQNLHASD